MASIQDLFIGATQEAKEALRFYEENYSSIGRWILEPGKKITVGDTVDRTCRFCGKHSPEVTFENEAHAIPECTGNKSLFSAHECDDCNGLFGRGIEKRFRQLVQGATCLVWRPWQERSASAERRGEAVAFRT